MRPAEAIVGLWVAFAVSWVAAAAWQRTTEKRAGARAEIRYRLVLIAGGILLGVPARQYVGPLRLWRVTWAEAWISVAVMAIGFLFAWWARVHLGSLWSGTITKKTDHRVIDSGPYAIVRHPIYTGILIAVLATAAVKGTVLALVAAAIITLGLWMKAKLEEGWLRQELGPDAYDAYRRRVPMLVPFGPTAGTDPATS
jgi:protein-S-isoprenylcysteine O-methyltransferase Ste14